MTLLWTALALIGPVGALAPSTEDWSFTLVERAVMFAGPLALLWFMILRPRVAVVDEQLVIVQWRRTIIFPLESLIGVQPHYYGADFNFSDGNSAGTAVFDRPNWAAWAGKQSRGDRIAYQLRCLAAARRGEPAPALAGFRRGPGDPASSILAGLGVAIAAILNGFK